MFAGKKFDVEHALSMFAYSYVHFPASELYNVEALTPLMDTIGRCHIYIIGVVPKIKLNDMEQKGHNLIVSFTVNGCEYKPIIDVPAGFNLVKENEAWHLQNVEGIKIVPNSDMLMTALGKELGGIRFEVQYIGQAFGGDGSRNAHDRLLKHETLQKISLQGVPDGHKLELILLEIQPNNRLITVFNPFAEELDEGEERIANGLDKLFDTSEQERITLYEASLIRYFQPKFNKEFKNSFPSTRMKLLNDCYKKDFSALIAEICFDNMYYHLCSNNVKPKDTHIATHYLHDDESRNVFFSKGE